MSARSIRMSRPWRCVHSTISGWSKPSKVILPSSFRTTVMGLIRAPVCPARCRRSLGWPLADAFGGDECGIGATVVGGELGVEFRVGRLADLRAPLALGSDGPVNDHINCRRHGVDKRLRV